MSAIKKINHERNLQQRVYEIIKEYVISTDLSPGTRLYEESLSVEIGVSRTPLRMALNRLSHEGLVELRPNKGAYKAHLYWEEVVEIIKIRANLESLAIELADHFDRRLIEDLSKTIPQLNDFVDHFDIKRYAEFDKKFHENLVKIGKGERVPSLVQTLDGLFHMLRFISLQGSDIERIKWSIQGHKEICQSLKANNKQKTVDNIKKHYEISLKDLEERRRYVPGLFRAFP